MDIRPIQIEDAEGFRQALDAVASEREFLLTLVAPPLEAVTAFVRDNVENGYPQYVAVEDDRIIGWADFIPSKRESLAHTVSLGMGVMKSWRGCGVGTALLSSVQQAAIAQGYTRLELEVFTSNVAAIGLYQKHGYELEGTKRNARLIDGKYSDIHLMARLID